MKLYEISNHSCRVDHRRKSLDCAFNKKDGIKDEDDDIQVYKRPWVGLTPDERYECIHGESVDAWDIAKAVEAKLKEKNT